MEWNDLLSDGYGRILDGLEHTFDGITPEDLNWQPRPDSNSIGWLAWHLTRGQDSQIAALKGEEQLWLKDGWYARFGRQPDAKDTGFGHTSQDVAAFKSPDVETVLDYHRKVLERSRDYFLSLSKEDLDRVLDEPWFQPLPTVGVRLVSILADSLNHIGQMGYVRGLRQGKGWQKF